MRLVLAVTAATFSMADAIAGDVRILQFPDTVLGTWALGSRTCGGSERGTISISPNRHSSADSSCRVAWITVTASRDGPVYSARSNCRKDDGGENEPPSYLVVSPRPDGRLLVRMPGVGPDDQLVTYQKCP